jgi:UDP-2,4-diacetamido-2,4,6-trideoxy-beta-L-altropyranose hydrolase
MAIETLLIRADANAEIGIGHVMRCLALAQAWRDAGGRVAFALAAGAKELGPRLRTEGADALEISAEPGSAEDASQTVELCTRYKAQWLVLDGYHFSREYRESVKAGTTRLLLVDDHGNDAPYRCDVVLNPNPFASDDLYASRGDETRFLVGPHYALLRREFLEFPRRGLSAPTEAKRILLTFGGSDQDNVTLYVLQALDEISDTRLEITVVIGASNPPMESLTKATATSCHAARLLSNVDNMPEIISRADLAISAGGVTCCELAFMRVPMFLITLARNHEESVEAWGRAKAAWAGGWFDVLERKSLAESLRRLIGDSELRREFVENAARVVDGKGAERVVEAMRCARAKDVSSRGRAGRE